MEKGCKQLNISTPRNEQSLWNLVEMYPTFASIHGDTSC